MLIRCLVCSLPTVIRIIGIDQRAFQGISPVHKGGFGG